MTVQQVPNMTLSYEQALSLQPQHKDGQSSNDSGVGMDVLMMDISEVGSTDQSSSTGGYNHYNGPLSVNSSIGINSPGANESKREWG